MALPLLAARVFGTPLLIAPSKLDAILGVIGPRLGLDVDFPAPQAGPETEAKARGQVHVVEGDAPEQAPAAARIAVVPIVGTLANRVDWMDAMSGMTSYETLASELDRLAADPSVDAILLEVDSFGGEAAGCFDAADRIHAARQAKPVWGVANQYAMSAGYALLSQCERVFVPQSGEVGSIGVVTTHIDVTKAAEAEGVRVTHVYAGEHKVDLSPFRELSEETRGRLEADIGQLYDQFVGLVGRGGRADADAARGTEALTFIGERAVDAGLADEVGTRAEALSALAHHVQEQKQMKDLAEANARLMAENTALKAKIVAFEAAEEARQKRADADYLEALKTESAKAQAPIAPEDIAKVEAHLAAGRRDFAHELGDAYLRAAAAKGGAPAKTIKVAPEGPASDHERAVKRGHLRNERARIKQALRSGALSDRAAAQARIDQINEELEKSTAGRG